MAGSCRCVKLIKSSTDRATDSVVALLPPPASAINSVLHSLTSGWSVSSAVACHDTANYNESKPPITMSLPLSICDDPL